MIVIDDRSRLIKKRAIAFEDRAIVIDDRSLLIDWHACGLVVRSARVVQRVAGAAGLVTDPIAGNAPPMDKRWPPTWAR
ncbi:MAG TPA: hypothetical protein VHE78_07285 [Gemmatimonadaceae bacterium]|nr:hypothetical protein [Gemmatimonadaceae bacterium]